MDIDVAGIPFSEWQYTVPGWWTLGRDVVCKLPFDGSARLRSGTRSQVEHLRETGKLATNMVGATSSDYVDCDLPITGLCYAAP